MIIHFIVEFVDSADGNGLIGFVHTIRTIRTIHIVHIVHIFHAILNIIAIQAIHAIHAIHAVGIISMSCVKHQLCSMLLADFRNAHFVFGPTHILKVSFIRTCLCLFMFVYVCLYFAMG